MMSGNVRPLICVESPRNYLCNVTKDGLTFTRKECNIDRNARALLRSRSINIVNNSRLKVDRYNHVSSRNYVIGRSCLCTESLQFGIEVRLAYIYHI